MTDKMFQINMKAYGGEEVLFVETAAIPQPKAGEVLIRTAYAGVNRPDVMQRQGLYPMPDGVTPIMGLEVSGTVVSLGAGVEGFEIGEPVCALTDGGGYAGYCTVPFGQVLPLPRGFSLAEAAMLPETYFTVWANLFMDAQMKPGESLLVHGGTSGIGLAALAIAQGLGLKTFATVGNDNKKQAVVAFGALPINYKTEDFAEIVQVNGGADGILDIVGARYFERNIVCLNQDGRLFLIGFMGGKTAREVDLLQIAVKRLTLTGSTMRGRNTAQKAAIAASLRERVWDMLADGRIAKPLLHRVFDYRDVQEAHREIDKGTHIGKILLDFTPSHF